MLLGGGGVGVVVLLVIQVWLLMATAGGGLEYGMMARIATSEHTIPKRKQRWHIKRQKQLRTREVLAKILNGRRKNLQLEAQLREAVATYHLSPKSQGVTTFREESSSRFEDRCPQRAKKKKEVEEGNCCSNAAEEEEAACGHSERSLHVVE